MSDADTTYDDLSLWKTRAEHAEHELCNIATVFRAAEPTDPRHIHHLFAELYLCVTRRWLAHLSQRNHSEYAYRVICRFLEFYIDQVPRRLDQPLSNIEQHWRSYHRMARRQTINSPISSHLILLSSGVRAHIQGDLGRAMCIVEEEIGYTATLAAHARAEKDEMLGVNSEMVFYQAAVDHLDEQHNRQAGWRRLILKLYRVGLYILKPIWVTVFQRWRRTGYAKAMAKVQLQEHANST